MACLAKLDAAGVSSRFPSVRRGLFGGRVPFSSYSATLPVPPARGWVYATARCIHACLSVHFVPL